jgi:N-acetylmuramoyl-L-alanine amidase
MRKLVKQLLLVIVATLAINPLYTFADSTYEVKEGDSLWAISNNFGISLNALRQVNNKYDHLIFPGQSLKIPSTISKEDKELLAKLIRAEAVGEPFAGKVAVATVVLNRVDSNLFPNTIKEVIYEVSPGGYYAFSPVQNGQINKPADEDSYRAVEEAIAFRGQGQGSIYFYNPVTAKSEWILSRQVTIQIGNHVFAK